MIVQNPESRIFVQNSIQINQLLAGAMTVQNQYFCLRAIEKEQIQDRTYDCPQSLVFFDNSGESRTEVIKTKV